MGDKIFCFPDSGNICFYGMDLGVWHFPDRTSLVAAVSETTAREARAHGLLCGFFIPVAQLKTAFLP